MAGVVYCVFLHQDVCSVWYIMLTVSGALDVCCMYAVCSCTKVPLAVSGVRILGMCGVLYVLASKCLYRCRVQGHYVR